MAAGGGICSSYVYSGYVVTSTTEDFAPGTNTILRAFTPNSPLGSIRYEPTSEVKGIRIIPSYLFIRGQANFDIYAYTPLNPAESSQVSKAVYVFPNPFNPERGKVNFHYVITQPGKVDIRIYDAGGNQVAVIADQVETSPGIYNSQAWDGRNYRGQLVANGIYFGRVKVGNKTTGVKIAVMR